MTATQAPPAASAPEATAAPRTRAPATGLAGILGSADHKVIGRLYLGAAIAFGAGTAVTGLLGGLQRVDSSILDRDVAPQVLTFHLTSAVLLAVAPALLGLAMVVVPLQVGARAIAFPRAAAASFWGYLVGAGLTVAAFAIDGGPGGGRSDAVDLWTAAWALVTVSLLLGAVCVATTALAVRTRGMGLDRSPMLTWSMLCTSVVWLLTLPVLVAVLMVMFIDHRFAEILFEPGPGATFARVSWVGQQPQVYVFAVPVLGVALDAVATATGARMANRAAARVAIGAFAVLGVGCFSLTAVSPEAVDQPVTKGMALLAPLPVLAVLGVAATALRTGRPKPTSGLVGGVVALLVLLLATLVGAATAFEGALELAGTQWGTAQSQLTLVAVVIAGVAGLYHWSTKVLGRVAGEGAGRTAPLVLALGAVVLAVPQCISALAGDAEEKVAGIEGLNVVALVGAVIVVLGGLLALSGLVGRRPADAPADPWGGQTLEWATASPPPFGNFDGEVPEVTSAEPLLAAPADDEEASA